MSPGALVRDATAADAPRIAWIYNHYVEHTVITFEVGAVPDEEFASRVAAVQDAGLPWLVAERGGRVAGFAYGGFFRPRAAYLHSIEITVYLDPEATQAGLGRALYTELFARLRALTPEQSVHAPVHRVVAGIALPNDASVALHESFGMRKIAHFSEVGRKFEQWIDVGFWEVALP